MRFVVRVLAFVIGSGAVTAVLADPPASTQASAAPAASTPSAAAAAPATSAAPASSASATASATSSAAAKPAVDADEKRLIAEGYKPEMRGGTKVYCKREQVLGSRLGTAEHCGTAEQLKSLTQTSREATEQSQRYGTNPTGR